MTEDLFVRKLNLPLEQDSLCAFLTRHTLYWEDDIEAAFGIFDLDETLWGCGCAAGSLLKCFAVDESLRGQNALGPLVSALIQDRFSKGFYDLFVITRAHNEVLFANCGLHTVVRTKELVMMENRSDGPGNYARSFLRHGDETAVVGAIVMNCDPFTLGHQYLVKQAAGQCVVLHLFVVEEDRSFFPTADRLQLVQAGTADLPNVRVHLSGHYMISSATFPKYFLKADEDATSLQSELDIQLFAESIAPVLHITRRFAGEEPFDAATARYNAAMKRLLPSHGISFVEIPRKTIGGSAISASRVRTLLRTPGTFSQALSLVPPSTQAYLIQHKESYYGR